MTNLHSAIVVLALCLVDTFTEDRVLEDEPAELVKRLKSVIGFQHCIRLTDLDDLRVMRKVTTVMGKNVPICVLDFNETFQ